MNLDEFYNLVELAEASYADLQDYDNDAVEEALTDDEGEIESKFSATQASNFVERWSVLHHQPDTDSDFSATLFKSKSTEGTQYVLAIRGTAGFWDDLVETDGGDIVADGLAWEQILDLYNCWQQLTAQEGAVYQVATTEILAAESAAYQLAAAGQAVLIDGLSTPADRYLEQLRSRSDLIIDEPLGLVRQIITTTLSTDKGDRFIFRKKEQRR